MHATVHFLQLFKELDDYEMGSYNSYNKSQRDALFLNFILIYNSTCIGQTYFPSSGVLILYSQQLVFVILVMLTVC